MKGENALALYDDIGLCYDCTRRADDAIINKFIDYFGANKQGHYLEIGCGTANYLISMIEKGFKSIVGLDPSEYMLNVARKKCCDKGINREPGSWIHVGAENMPFLHDTFDGVYCIHALHHIKRKKRAAVFKDLFYMLRNGGSLVLFTNSHAQINRYWLNHYFPNAMETLKSYMPDVSVLEQELWTAGFRDIKPEPFYIDDKLTDLFLYSMKHKPEAYLNEKFRNNMSLFKVKATDREEIKKGVDLLSKDCLSGEAYNIIGKSEYDNNGIGDYLFLVCKK